LAQQRIDHLLQAGFKGDREGMETWIAAQNNPQDISKAWNQLLQAGSTAQRLNELNGKLILIHLQHNQQALSALSTAANQSSVYGPDGQPHNTISTSSRIIGKV
jgi:flagella synthesis protein FlgN